MKKSQILGIAVGATLAMGLSVSAFATDGYQLIGIGQYAVGMAGAVVAAPDDPLSAAISNPAGLALMAPQAAFSAEIFNPVRKTNLGFGEIGSHTNVYGVPAIGWVAPAFGDGIVFGGGVYGTSGLGVNYLQNVPANPNMPYGGYAQAFSSITFMQMAPSIAMKVNHHLAVGATLNIAAEQASFQQTFSQYASAYGPMGPLNTGGLNLANPSWAYGAGFTLGMLYKVNDMVTLGLTYKSPIWFSSLNWQAGVQNQINPQTMSGVYGTPGQYSGTLNYPQQVAFGLAIRPIPQWLISVEGQWINWASTMNNFDVSGPWNAVYHGAPAGSVSSIALPMHWKNQWVANIGTQYDLTNWLQVRAGYTYGSNPISNNTIASNLIFPAIVQSAITFGATQKLGMGWKLTEAYMHEFSNTNTGPAGSSPFGGPMPVSATMYENSYGLQIGYVF
ncbi:OmpP1/FadL family transporter [Acidithiobacillus sp.]|jgi:long-chain fatty acid transport protein|uniref:OmpP1/FadL family transporter n=1 Tax=Acidithiobacillus sp. TaxID=1872118 RepID=UPI0025C3A77B|nr:outer membrane protein transport protein [Acidithiobacillus sp.]MCK9189529.1 outer membrane protein transport protein [Acidithiobacillus sp.]MCK9359148.1 outer membrane protein transport protein [Acidithiobacillus sp.]